MPQMPSDLLRLRVNRTVKQRPVQHLPSAESPNACPSSSPLFTSSWGSATTKNTDISAWWLMSVLKFGDHRKDYLRVPQTDLNSVELATAAIKSLVLLLLAFQLALMSAFRS